jgi:hypothetical protein
LGFSHLSIPRVMFDSGADKHHAYDNW